VYVREFSPGADGKPVATAKHQISTNGGRLVGWGDGGKELIWVSREGQSTLVRTAGIVTRPVFQAQPEKLLFQRPNSEGIYSVDGKRFLTPISVTQGKPLPFNVVLNWPVLLQK
jgi:hypothetical protein